MKKIIKSLLNLLFIMAYNILMLIVVLITIVYLLSVINNDTGRIWKTILILFLLFGFLIELPSGVDEKFKINSWALFFSYKNASLRTFLLFPFLMPFVLYNGISWMNSFSRGYDYKSSMIYTVSFLGVLIFNIIISIFSVYRASERAIEIERDKKIKDIFALLMSRDINQESYITCCPSCAAVEILDLGKSKACQYCHGIIVRQVLNHAK